MNAISSLERLLEERAELDRTLTSKLQKSILQEAIQGRLVPQDPSEEPASELLKRIRKEKEQLVKESKLKKKDLESKPIEEDEIPFEIPESWEWVRLQYLCTRFSTGPFGTMVHKEDYVDLEGHPLVNPTNIKDGRIVVEGIKKVSNTKYEELGSYVLQTNDLVLARRGDLSKIAIVTEKEKGWLAGTGAFFMHFLDGLFLPFFILLYSSFYCQSYLLAQSVGGTMNNLNQKLLSDFLIPLPPLAEQRRIVAKIEELMPLVERYGKAQDELDQLNESLPARLRQSILQEAIQGRLVPQDPNDEPASVLLQRIRKEKERLVKEGKLKKKDLESKPIEEDEIPFEIPESWEWCVIGDLFAHNNGKQLNKGNARGKMMDYITTSNLYWDGFVLDNLKQMPFEDSEIDRCQAVKGDLLVCEGGDIGRAAIWNYDYPIMLQNHLHKLRAYVPLCTEYFRYLFYYYNKSGMIGGKGIGIQGFSSKTLHNTLVPLPPLSEQKRIVAKIEELFGVMFKY